MVYIENLDKRNNIPISNKYELINESLDDMHYVLYYIDDYKFHIIIRRLDASCGWGVNLKIKLYSENNDSQIISLGSSEKNYKIMNINCKIKLNKIVYNDQDIPKIIIQTTYNRDIGDILHYNSILSYIELNPEYEYKIFDNNDSRLFIKNNFNEYTLIAYDLIIPGAFKADFFRYCILYITGGCYFDCKSILRIPLRNIIEHNDNFLLCKDVQEAYYNAVMLSSPKNELLLKTINMCIDNIYNFYKKYNLKKNLYDKAYTMFSFTGPILIYNSVKNNINNNNIKFIHKYDQNRKNHYNHYYQRLFVEYKSQYIITKQYSSYISSSGVHYSSQWLNKEIIYELCNLNDNTKYKFYKFITNVIDKFDFYVFSERILIIERIDNDSGWGDFLKIKIINENTDKELLLNIGSSNNKEKIIYLDNIFFNNDNIIKYYTFYNNNADQKFSISICKNKNNIDKLIIINNENTGWTENFNLHILLNNDKIYNINIDASEKNIKIIDFIY
jgi:mannosyltransferase OCH1-like enzyme